MCEKFHLKKKHLNIRKSDLELGCIHHYNWPADQIKKKDLKITNMLFDSLENYDTNIWIPGYEGIIILLLLFGFVI